MSGPCSGPPLSHLQQGKPHPTIDPRCKGCGKCRKNCPMEAITGAAKQVHVIDPEKCINCGACVTNCPFGAIAASK
ncbi:4Fe-4S binding protein [Oscillibacter sp.]|uniref:4Fe-4S binding protein n=1 Tax=Oscillibacter sp. TaxID=1945593 RepID=UPI00338D3704